MSAIDLLSLFRRELELCKVQPGEVMAVLSGPNSRADYIEAFVAAGQQLGAEVFHLHLPQPTATGRQTPTTAQGALWGVTPLTGHRSGIEILKKAEHAGRPGRPPAFARATGDPEGRHARADGGRAAGHPGAHDGAARLARAGRGRRPQDRRRLRAAHHQPRRHGADLPARPVLALADPAIRLHRSARTLGPLPGRLRLHLAQ